MSFIEKLRHAFAFGEEALTKEEEDLLQTLAKEIVKRGMGTVAILFLEPFKPLSFIGSQVMVFLEPFVSAIFPTNVYKLIEKALEKRSGVEVLIRYIEKEMQNDSKG